MYRSNWCIFTTYQYEIQTSKYYRLPIKYNVQKVFLLVPLNKLTIKYFLQTLNILLFYVV